jgi:predicted DNA-binding transcriptional regulator AlpA
MAHPEVTGKAIAKTGDTGDDAYLPAARVRQRYGVSAMSIYRWLLDAKLRFPKPIYIGRYRYWRLSDLVAWEINRASSKAA